MKANRNQIQPCKLPEAIPLKRAPILQPNASLAPNPIKKPPSIVAKIIFGLISFLLLNAPAKLDAIKAPKIIPSPTCLKSKKSTV